MDARSASRSTSRARCSSPTTWATRSGESLPPARPGAVGKGGEVAGLPQHLVDLGRVHLLGEDHSAREFLERDVAAFHQGKKLAVKRERLAFGFERLPQHVADVVLVRF